MTNFVFLKAEWPTLYKPAYQAEKDTLNDPRTACFHARRALELAVAWLYDHDRAFQRPYDDNLSSLLTDASFRQNVPTAVFAKAQLIRKLGNQAVHSHQAIKPEDALTAVRELFHVLYWLARTYTRADPAQLPTTFNEAHIPPPAKEIRRQTLAQLQQLDNDLKAKDAELQQKNQAIAGYEAQIAALQAQIAANKQANTAIPVFHDYSEAETRRHIIDLLLREAGWDPQAPHATEYEVDGMPNTTNKGYVDYVLWGADGLPLGLVEAKRTSKDPHAGKQQAKLYADALEKKFGRRPIIFFTNGYETHLWDDHRYPSRPVQGFYTADELEWLIQRRTAANPAHVPTTKTIINRYYQEEAVRAVAEHFAKNHRKGLVVMATGSGKTRVAIALCDLLMRSGWVKRALFLADRDALVRQAVKAFKKYLPTSSPVNLVEDKEALDSRVVVSTYHTMMRQIDETKGNQEKRFSVGHFDLVFIDEAHRSVYRKFGAIFQYFDGLLVGLTATPKDEVDRNTYHLFELEDGVPTYAYDLQQAVDDSYLVPPRAAEVPLQFMREGIQYDALSPQEQEEWDLLDWDEAGRVPEKVEATKLYQWLFNADTVDKVLETLMRHGVKVQGGDRLGKTIIFAKNHAHAQFIEERFDKNYPHLAGKFARVIDNYQTYAHSLIDEFAKPNGPPHLAISVDMLDTGVDIPEVVNLVFFKLVRSKTKFFQMMGRGTRLCPDLFGPSQDKTHFAVFDFCQNFEFFNQHPKGYEAPLAEPLSQRLFNYRLRLLQGLMTEKKKEPLLAPLATAVSDHLHHLVANIPLDNFLVRPHRKYVEPFRNRARWDVLTKGDWNDLNRYVSGLPSQLPEEDESAKRFDLLCLQLQLAHLEAAPSFNSLRDQITAVIDELQWKDSIPMVKAQLPLLEAMLTDAWWQAVNLPILEEMRQRVRGLAQLITHKARKPLFTDFEDRFMGEMKPVQIVSAVSGMNTTQYRKKVEQFLHSHEDYWVIYKIRWAIPLEPRDLEALEAFFFAAGETESRQVFEQVYGKQPNLAAFIRRLVGLNRRLAKERFARFLDDQVCTADQIRFVNFLVDYLTQNGEMEPGVLYERPFTDLHELGPDGLFPEPQANELFAILETINRSVYPVMATG